VPGGATTERRLKRRGSWIESLERGDAQLPGDGVPGAALPASEHMPDGVAWAGISRLARFVTIGAVAHAATRHQTAQNPSVYESEQLVVFADVSGFTKLAEWCQAPSGVQAQALAGAVNHTMQGAERMSEALNEYFGEMINILVEAGADIVKFAGDALVATWTLPSRERVSAHAAASLRAVSTCLRMTEALDQYQCRGLPSDRRLRLHVAVGCGRLRNLFVGGVEDAWLQLQVGEPMAQVAPLVDIAKPGEFVVSNEMWAVVKGSATGRPLEGGAGVQVLACNERVWCAPSDSDSLESSYKQRIQQVVPRHTYATVARSLQSFVPTPTLHAHTAGLDASAELRRVTVLFVMLEPPAVGSEAPRVLDEVQVVAQAMQRQVLRHGGFIKELTLDDKGLVLVAGFGLPPCIYAQDPAVSACEAALALEHVLEQQGRRCGIGLTTGDAFCGTVGSRIRAEYGMVGAIVNLAARLMAAAWKLDKRVLVDEATQLVTSMAVRYSKPRELKVKGKDEPVQVYRLKGVVSTIRVASSKELSSTPCSPQYQRSLQRVSSTPVLLDLTSPRESTNKNSIGWDTRASSGWDTGISLVDRLSDEHEDGRGEYGEPQKLHGRVWELSTFEAVLFGAREWSIRGGKSVQLNQKGGAREMSFHAVNSVQLNREVNAPSEPEVHLPSDSMAGAWDSANEIPSLSTSPKQPGDGVLASCLPCFGARSARNSLKSPSVSVKPTFVLLEGDAGIGKTALLREMVGRAKAAGAITFFANFGTRLAALTGWFQVMEAMIGRTDRSALSAEQARQLDIVLAFGATLATAGKHTSAEIGHEDRMGVLGSELVPAFCMLLNAVAKDAEGKPVLLALDGGSQLDDIGFSILERVLNPGTQWPHMGSVVLCMATRPLPLSSKHFTSLRRLASVSVHMVLQGLDAKTMCYAMSDMLEDQGVRRMDSIAGMFLCERSSGNPRDAAIWARHLIDSRKATVTTDGNLWLHFPKFFGDISIPTPVWISCTANNDLLPPELLLTLRLCSVLGEATPELLELIAPPEVDLPWHDLLPTLVSGGFLLERTRGAVAQHGDLDGRDSLDGSTALLSYHALLLAGEPELAGLSPTGMSHMLGSRCRTDSSMLTFRSFVHQQVTHHGWALKHRKNAHLRVRDLAGLVISKCLALEHETLSFNMSKLEVACHAWCVHHSAMAADFAGARAALHLASERVGAQALRQHAVEKATRLFGSSRFNVRPQEWQDLHAYVVPWMSGIAQVFQLRAQRRWAIVKMAIKLLVALLRTREGERRQMTRELSGTNLAASSSLFDVAASPPSHPPAEEPPAAPRALRARWQGAQGGEETLEVTSPKEADNTGPELLRRVMLARGGSTLSSFERSLSDSSCEDVQGQIGREVTYSFKFSGELDDTERAALLEAVVAPQELPA